MSYTEDKPERNREDECNLYADTPMPARWEKLGPFDLFLCDDNNGTNAPVITAVFRFAGQLSFSFVVQSIATPLGTHPRLRSILNEKRSRFELQDDFDPSAHITHHDYQLTSTVLDVVLSTPLPLNAPRWSLHVFSAPDASHTDIVLRIDHVIGDGVGLVRYCLSVIESQSKSTAPPTVQMPPKQPLNAALVAAGAEPTCWDAVSRPFRDCMATFITMFIPDRPNVMTRATLSNSKRCAWARTRSVIDLRSAARQLGVTLNDLVLCALSGAIRAYMEAQDGGGSSNSRVTVAIPMNGHKVSEQSSTHRETDFLHNALIILPLVVHLGERDTLRRLARVTRSMRDMKRGYRLPFSLIAFRLLAAMPQALRVPLWRHLTKRVSLMFSNVPGPAHRLELGSHVIQSLRVLAPTHGSTGVAFTAFSYADELNIGLLVDENRVQKPEQMMHFFDDELDATLAWVKALKQA